MVYDQRGGLGFMGPWAPSQRRKLFCVFGPSMVSMACMVSMVSMACMVSMVSMLSMVSVVIR